MEGETQLAVLKPEMKAFQKATNSNWPSRTKLEKFSGGAPVTDAPFAAMSL
jgi:hypothetical protein